MTAALKLDATAVPLLLPQVHLGVIAQHVDDAAFLFAQRERAARAPRVRLNRLLSLDERLEANLAGLRFAGDAGWACVAEGLAEPEGLFTAACVALASGRKKWIEIALKVSLDPATPALRAALIAALGFVDASTALLVLEQLWATGSERARAAALQGFAAQRLDPGDRLACALLDERPSVVALEAAALLGRADLVHMVVRRVASSDTADRFAAALASARLGLRDRDVMLGLRQGAEAGGALAGQAAAMLVRCLPREQAKEWTQGLLRGTGARFALAAATALGDPFLLMELAHLLEHESTARMAGEAFCRVTGVVLEDAGLTRPRPESVETTPNDDLADGDVSMALDDDLPWPDADRLRDWWCEHQRQFDPRVRYLCGRPKEPGSLLEILGNGCQPVRAAAAQELALLAPAEPLFPVQSRAHHQLRRLKQSASQARRA